MTLAVPLTAIEGGDTGWLFGDMAIEWTRLLNLPRPRKALLLTRL